MSKKDYITIAAILNKHLNKDMLGNLFIEDIIEELSSFFKEENPAFNKEKFLKACYRS